VTQYCKWAAIAAAQRAAVGAKARRGGSQVGCWAIKYYGRAALSLSGLKERKRFFVAFRRLVEKRLGKALPGFDTRRVPIGHSRAWIILHQKPPFLWNKHQQLENHQQ
jgi:hypothetical protein